jgi:hypothetical protein
LINQHVVDPILYACSYVYLASALKNDQIFNLYCWACLLMINILN